MKSCTPESRFTRRQFLQATALASVAAPFVLPSGLRGALANAKLNHACIGVGGMGWNDLNTFLQHLRSQVVALCDVAAVGRPPHSQGNQGCGSLPRSRYANLRENRG